MAFSVEGKHVAAIAKEEKVLKIWTLPSGILNLFSHSLNPSRELSLSGDESNSGK